MEKLFFVLIIIILTSLFFVSSAKEDKISQEVYEKLEKNGVARVVIKINIGEGEMGIKKNIEEEVGKENLKHVFGDYIAASVSKKELEKLVSYDNIESVIIDKPIKAFLQDSVLLINASRIWPTQVSGTNITGAGETICVIDTGINFTHSALIGKNKTCIIDCLNKACVENCSVSDDNGHGTHVAGIIAASGGINGVAVGASLIGVKVLNSAGSGSGSDLDAAIDWCITNRNSYNISVISMSLGTESPNLYNNYCDGSEPTTAPRINNATYYNISVIAATGNEGNTTHIASPACIQNVTAVGSVRKDDSTIYYNRNSITHLLAPGVNINSTSGPCLAGCACSGNYMVCSGTSMATPHIAGAFVLVRQFFKLQNNRVPTPKEIKDVLNNTGKIIYDSSSGLNFSRINIYSALVSLDETPPNVSLISPINNSINSLQNKTFKCNATDWQLSNITLQIWNSTSFYYTNTTSANGGFAEVEWNVSNIPYENYKWNCLAYDRNNNYAQALSNYTYNVNRGKKIIVIGIDGFQYNHYVSMLNSGVLTNFTRLISSGGWNGTHNITGHSSTNTAPGNAEMHTGLNESLTGVSDNTCNNPVPDGNTTFERLESFDSSIVTGAIYGKTTCYLPNGVLGNSWQNIDWWQNRSTYSPTAWSDGTACDNSKNVSIKATEFIGNYTNSSFYLFVYFGVPDCSGHVGGDNSVNYNNSFINVDDGLGIILNSLESNGINGSVQIIVTADHGWNEGTTSHGTANKDTIVLPLITNNASMVSYITSDGIREQCEVAPTILNFFGLTTSDYQEVIDNGCESMVERELVSPQVTINSPTSTTYTADGYNINLTINEDGYCEYSLDRGIMNNTLTNTGNRMFTLARTGVSNGAYVLNAYCNDSSGNKNYTESVNFSISISSTVIQASGGGGGTATSKAYIITTEQASEGYTQTLSKDDKIKFAFFDEKAFQHTLNVDYVGENFVNLTIQSSTIKLVLGIGQSAKLNLTSPDYYDMYLRLNSIENNKAKITIQTIHEEIPRIRITGEPIKEEIEEVVEVEETEDLEKEQSYFSFSILIRAVIILILVIFIVFIRIKTHQENRISFPIRVLLNFW